MTNFEPIKEKIWSAVEHDDKSAFDSECKALMEKAVNDWWRLGWGLAPKDVNEFLKIIENLATESDKLWKEAMKNGDAPPEDVSPAEGFMNCYNVIKNAISDKNK